MKAKAPNPDNNTYKNLVDLLAIFSDASNQVAALQASVEESYLGLVDSHREEYAALQKVLADAEASIRFIAAANPDWFIDPKTLKTPYGTVAFRSVTKLLIPNEEASILLLEKLFDENDRATFLRQSIELNREALETLDDATLKKLRITRTNETSCTVKPAKVDLGKAVKSPAKAGKEAA